MASTTQTQVLQDLSYLLGETTIPSSVPDRQDYIQKSLERIYRAYNFPMTQLTATVKVNAGIASLSGINIAQDGLLDVREVVAGPYADHVYVPTGYKDSNNYAPGDYSFWLTGYEGTYVLNTSETSSSPIVTLFFQSSVPQINASISTPFSSSMAIALGALKYYRLAEDPYTDVAPYETMFQLEMGEVIANYNRNRAMVRGRTQSEQDGTYTGDITTVGAYVGNVGANN